MPHTPHTHPLHDRGAIGLLAGMGVRSTAPFLDLMIRECQRQYGARSERDYPPMIVFSWPLPFDADAPIDHDAVRDTIAAGLRWLDSTGVAFLAMPCNTAHIYFDQLVPQVASPLLNMVGIAAEAIPEGTGRIALLATRATRDAEIYQPVLRQRGFEVLATDALQERTDALLSDIHHANDTAALRPRWEEFLQAAAAEGAEAGLVACTDLNVLFGDGYDASLLLVDGAEALAARVVERWRKGDRSAS